MKFLSLFRRKPARTTVNVTTFTKTQKARPSIHDAFHMKLREEVAARGHERFANDFAAATAAMRQEAR
jgi:hypothetical protein